MRPSLLLSFALSAFLVPIICHASEGEVHGPGYDFVEVGWAWLDAGHDGDGFAGNLSVSVTEQVFLYANASFVDFKHGGGSADSLRSGVGLRAPLNNAWDFVIRGGAAQHIDEGHKSYGVQAEKGVKGKFTPQFESWLMVGRSNWRDEHFYDQTFVRANEPKCESRKLAIFGLSALQIYLVSAKLHDVEVRILPRFDAVANCRGRMNYC